MPFVGLAEPEPFVTAAVGGGGGIIGGGGGGISDGGINGGMPSIGGIPGGMPGGGGIPGRIKLIGFMPGGIIILGMPTLFQKRKNLKILTLFYKFYLFNCNLIEINYEISLYL